MQEKQLKIDETGTIYQKLAAFSEEDLQSILNQSNSWVDYSRLNSLMVGIANNIKEVPDVPQNRPKDTNSISHVEFPDKGGILTHMSGFKYPYKGYPYFEFVDKIDILLKKTLRSFLSGLYHNLKTTNKLWFITLLPSIWMSKKVVRAFIFTIYRIVERFRIKPERYCDFIREFYLAFNKEGGELRGMLRDIVCMILEYDNAYRFRAQDILVEINKDALRKNPAKELTRLFLLMMERENDQKVVDTWRLMNYVIQFYLRYDKELLYILRDTLLELDISKIALSMEDKEYCITRKDYRFKFMENMNQEEKDLLKLSMVRDEFKEKIFDIQEESTKKHQAMLESHKNEKAQLTNGKLQEVEQRQKEELKELDSFFEKQIKEAEERYNKML